jgi:tRNA (mo5U34)-methyltransferase
MQAQADALHWYHSIDLGNGVVTKGTSGQENGPEILPDLSGRSVLDIGAWDGRFSFLAEAAGASRVVALDHYAWGVDFAARGAYWSECIANGTLPDQSRDETDFWLPDLPGRRGFEFAAAALGSSVEPVVADFQTVDLDEVGQFDVVLYLGVLYHMKEPLTCLERVRSVTKEVAVIETEAVHLAGLGHEALLQFHAGSSLRIDFGNWYVPTIEALHNLCRAAGFSRIETVVGPPVDPPRSTTPETFRERLGRRLAGIPTPVPVAPSANYRAVVHAFV